MVAGFPETHYSHDACSKDPKVNATSTGWGFGEVGLDAIPQDHEFIDFGDDAGVVRGKEKWG